MVCLIKIGYFSAILENSIMVLLQLFWVMVEVREKSAT